jgi:hypothetical protein
MMRANIRLVNYKTLILKNIRNSKDKKNYLFNPVEGAIS